MAYYWTQEQRRRWHEHQGYADRDPRTLVQVCIDEVGEACGRIASDRATADMGREYPHVIKVAATIATLQRAPTLAERAWFDLMYTHREQVEREEYDRALTAAELAARRILAEIRVARLARAA
jgi:hypothetical protein